MFGNVSHLECSGYTSTRTAAAVLAACAIGAQQEHRNAGASPLRCHCGDPGSDVRHAAKASPRICRVPYGESRTSIRGTCRACRHAPPQRCCCRVDRVNSGTSELWQQAGNPPAGSQSVQRSTRGCIMLGCTKWRRQACSMTSIRRPWLVHAPGGMQCPGAGAAVGMGCVVGRNRAAVARHSCKGAGGWLAVSRASQYS